MKGDQRRPDYVGLNPTCKAGDLFVLNDNDVVDLLKAAVEREGSQSAFAMRYNVNRTELNSILNGRRRISASLAKALGLRRVYVVEEEAKKHSARLSSLAASSAGVVGRHQGRGDFPGPLVVEADTTT
jgi:DNA-binding transcriptional regulator YdaS (Cro superfamily)